MEFLPFNSEDVAPWPL